MPISILPPSVAPTPSHHAAGRDADDSDVEMSDDDLPTATAGSKKAAIVTPGEHITNDPQWMRGHGTYIPNESTTIISTVAGTLHKTNKLLSVQALRARYQPEIGDLVIGIRISH